MPKPAIDITALRDVGVWFTGCPAWLPLRDLPYECFYRVDPALRTDAPKIVTKDDAISLIERALSLVSVFLHLDEYQTAYYQLFAAVVLYKRDIQKRFGCFGHEVCDIERKVEKRLLFQYCDFIAAVHRRTHLKRRDFASYKANSDKWYHLQADGDYKNYGVTTPARFITVLSFAWCYCPSVSITRLLNEGRWSLPSFAYPLPNPVFHLTCDHPPITKQTRMTLSAYAIQSKLS